METCLPEAHEGSVAIAPSGEYVLFFTSGPTGPGVRMRRCKTRQTVVFNQSINPETHKPGQTSLDCLQAVLSSCPVSRCRSQVLCVTGRVKYTVRLACVQQLRGEGGGGGGGGRGTHTAS